MKYNVKFSREMSRIPLHNGKGSYLIIRSNFNAFITRLYISFEINYNDLVELCKMVQTNLDKGIDLDIVLEYSLL